MPAESLFKQIVVYGFFRSMGALYIRQRMGSCHNGGNVSVHLWVKHFFTCHNIIYALFCIKILKLQWKKSEHFGSTVSKKFGQGCHKLLLTHFHFRYTFLPSVVNNEHELLVYFAVPPNCFLLLIVTGISVVVGLKRSVCEDVGGQIVFGFFC